MEMEWLAAIIGALLGAGGIGTVLRIWYKGQLEAAQQQHKELSEGQLRADTWVDRVLQSQRDELVKVKHNEAELYVLISRLRDEHTKDMREAQDREAALRVELAVTKEKLHHSEESDRAGQCNS